jgi:Protein of unknown function (DUF1638)
MLVIACGAIAKEILEVKKRNQWEHITLQCIPADLHNHPQKIPESVRAKIEEARNVHETIFVAYGDCGTGGLLDAVLNEYDIDRLPGAHCYEFLTGSVPFEKIAEEELGSYFLTDFLVRHFDRLVWEGMGIAKHPQLLPMYFEHYKRVVYLAQTESTELQEKAMECASRLGLEYKYHFTGLAQLQTDLSQVKEEIIKWQK